MQAAQFVLAIQTIVSREVKPLEPAVITVGSIHAGTKHNIISDRCHMQLTVRSYSDEVRTKLLEGIRRKAQAVAMGAGASKPEVVVSEGTPAVFNSEELAQRITAVFQQVLDSENVKQGEPAMAGEDFSRYGRAGVPILMYRLGTTDARQLSSPQAIGTIRAAAPFAGLLPRPGKSPCHRHHDHGQRRNRVDETPQIDANRRGLGHFPINTGRR